MINRTTYQIEMSTDGQHRVVVTIEDPAGTDAALAWASATYARLLRSESSEDGPERDNAGNEAEPPVCGVHDVPMVRVAGRRGPFWSCHQRNEDGSWCSFRPGR